MTVLLKIACLVTLIGICVGDVYMHNPRGSNNRLNERSANRNNANRLFDSQVRPRGVLAPNVDYVRNTFHFRTTTVADTTLEIRIRERLTLKMRSITWYTANHDPKLQILISE